MSAGTATGPGAPEMGRRRRPRLIYDRPDGCDPEITEMRIFLGCEVRKWFGRQHDDAEACIEGFALLISGNPHLQMERDAMLSLAEGLGILMNWGEAVTSGKPSALCDKLNSEQRWAANYFPLILGDRLKVVMANLAGLGVILSSCQATREIGLTVSNMERAWKFLAALSDDRNEKYINEGPAAVAGGFAAELPGGGAR